MYQTFSNNCDVRGSRPTGKVRVSLGRFDLTEPPRTTVTKRDAAIQGRFERVWGGSNTPNLLESL